MDVKRGHCWRCERSTLAQTHICSHCEIATYCSEKCRQDDQYRHKPECEVWGPKRCNNPTCPSTNKEVFECSSCNSVWYCGKVCQQQDWKTHKITCREFVRDIRNASDERRYYLHHRSSSCALLVPYYIGNAIAIDMLNLQANECEESPDQASPNEALKSKYKVLSAGCGNLRNLLHTVSSLPTQFEGKLDFHLNDFDPFIQARNIMFLFMMIAYADQADIAATLTTIWYSLHLSQEHYQLLIQSLNTLITLTAETLAEATGGFVTVDEEYIPRLKDVWRGWLDLQCLRSHPNSINLQKQRQDVFASDFASYQGVEYFKIEIPEKYAKSVDDWFQNGIFLPSDASRKKLDYDNPTLTGYNFKDLSYSTSVNPGDILQSPRLQTFVYCIAADLIPFGEWDQLLAEKYKPSKSLITMYHAYVTAKITETVQVLKSGKITISLTICNCLELSSKLAESSSTFDRIFTSNIVDYVGTRQLLRCMKSLLGTTNGYATLVLQYWNWKKHFPKATIDGDYTRFMDGTHSFCQQAAAKDVRHRNHHALASSRNFLQEYFNYTPFFVSFMRAEMMACEEENSAANKAKTKVVSFQQILLTEGLQMRNFRRGLNRVAPFAYRRNARPVNSLPGIERMVEWHSP